jgi:RimJ/RimL family protein N-acetyltransferase
MKNKNIRLEGKKIYLRTLKENDATEKYCSWLNDPDVTKYLETKKATIEEIKEYIKVRNNDPNCVFLGVFIKDSNIHIGNVKIEPIDFNKEIGTLGAIIGDKNYWGKGYASEAYKVLIEYVFEELKLEAIDGGIHLDHIGALKAVQKLGFKIDKIGEETCTIKLLKKDFISL